MVLRRRWIVTVLAGLLLLGAGTAAAVVSDADVAYIKQKVEAAEWLTPADIALAKEINATTTSHIDIERALHRAKLRLAGVAEATPPRDGRRSLDVYGWAEVTYDWVDISGLGNMLTPGDDSNQGPFNLGFAFPFYGNNYTSVRVCTNGFLQFGGGTSTEYSNGAIPSTSQPNNAVYPFWDDLDADNGTGVPMGQIRYYADAANQRFVVSWIGVPHWASTPTPSDGHTFQVILYPDGSIVLQYLTVAGLAPSNTSCTVGVENAMGTEAVQVCNNGSGTLPHNGWAIRIAELSGIPNPPTDLMASVEARDVILTWRDPSTDTHGNPLTIDNCQVWVGPPGTGTLLATVPRGTETYRHVDVSSGMYTYHVRASAAGLFGASDSVSLMIGSPTFMSDFESDNGGWVPDPATDGWEWGVPTYASGPAAHSGSNLWGTVLGGDYGASACYHLDLDLGLEVESAAATVEFWAWYDTEASYDGCNFKVSTDGGSTWTVVTPLGGYTGSTNTSNTCNPSQPAWTGHTVGENWHYIVIPIGQFQGQAPVFRFTLGADGSIQYPGFYFDDMVIWGLEQAQSADVSGTVTLNGGSGNVAQATVRANGLGSPSTNPAADGTYTLTNVQVGDRVITATLTGYDTARVSVTVPPGGLTNVNLTLTRTAPPAPTNLTGVVNVNVVTLDWDDSPDPLVDGYRLYRKLREDLTWVYQHTAYGRTNSTTTDTPTQGGIYQYRVTAIDTNVTPTFVESLPSNQIEVPYGALPPVMLTADGDFDNKIRLSWLAPGTPPEVEVYYDDGENDVDGVGWWSGSPTFGWLVAHYQGNGPITVTRLKMWFTSFTGMGDAIQVGLFADAGGGVPTFTPLGVIDANQGDEPLDEWREFEIDPPITFNDGSFFVGARQIVGLSPIALGADEDNTFLENTFMGCYSLDLGWILYETWELYAIPMQRCFAIGDIGGEFEMSPSPVRTPMPSLSYADKGPVRTVGLKSGDAKSGESRTAKGPTTPGKAVATVTKMDADKWSNWTNRSFETVPPHAPSVLGNDSRDRGRSLDEVVRYRIYRNAARFDSVAGTVLTYDDIGLTENVQYTYAVTAVYDNTEESPPSNSVQVACNMAPAAPANLTATPSGSTQMRLQWIDPTTNDDGTACVDLAGVKVYRDGTFLANVNPGVSQYTDTPPVANEFYTWEVKGFDEVPNIGPASSIRAAVQSPWQEVPYEWVDISTIGTSTGLSGDDDNAGPFNLGFPFPFYGQNYANVYVCSNGWLSFTSTDNEYWNVEIPDPTEPNAAIYPFWDDLYISDWVNYYRDTANNRFIVSWRVQTLSGTTTFDFQVILTAQGSITFNYQSLESETDRTVGVENADGTDAIQLCYDEAGDWIPEPESSVQFWGRATGEITGTVLEYSTNVPIASAQVWATGESDTAQTDVTGVYSLNVEPGTYTVNFRHAAHCDTSYANVVVEAGTPTVRNAVMKAPHGQASVSSITFTTWQGHDVSQHFNLSNTGGQCPLTFTITDTSGWLSSNPASGEVPAGGYVDIQAIATVTGMPPGTERHSQLRIVCNAAESPIVIDVDLSIALAADEDAAGVPTEFAYRQNFPNPFNATTALRFDVPREARVDIVIYNVMGQEVAHPVADVYAVGRHQVLFDASGLPSGMYLVKMNAGSFEQLGKMLLLK